ncbi:uncharacterized protein LOC112561459 [Pomacea canaliculata]|uniref:uncharacterized protein LOC112561459 n=1 Tax=Pomacea canaliculata TaxID=400727 RepID=UPI000D72C268|nr:uncharacterized protein LOC112561459 [Pomacea canaliculata]
MEAGRSASPATRRPRHQRRKPQAAPVCHPRDTTTPQHRQNDISCSTGTPPAHTVPSCSRRTWARRTVWLVTLLTLLLRVRHVFQESAWWILHPDEIYQSLEVAYSELHGYGFRTYEFLPPAGKDNPSLYSQKRDNSGCTPCVLRSSHASTPPYYEECPDSTIFLLYYTRGTHGVWRVAHIVVSSLLPLAAYRLVRSVFRCRDTGVVAAMLAASSVFTNVVATHTLIHGFLAPILFSSLAGILSYLCPKEDSERTPAPAQWLDVWPACCWVCDDVYFYGFFTVTPWNWFWFNVASGVQAQLFGTDSIMIYLHELLWKNAGMRMLFAANVIALVLMIRPSQERTNKICFRTEKTFRFISCLLIMLVIFSLQGHKEVRFIYNAMVVYLCISAASIVSLTHMFLKKLSFRAVSVAMVTILYAVSQWLDFPTPGDLSARTWTYRESMDSYDVSRCVRFISRQTDVRGVFINKHLYTFGGYTMLGHDVPILVRTFSGYHEYGFSARTKTTSRNWFGSSKEISIATSSKVSNLFSDFNKPHLLLHLITHTEYNYLVLDVEDDFFQASFKEVYVHGPLKVLKRLGSKADETKTVSPTSGAQSNTVGRHPGERSSGIIRFWFKRTGRRKIQRGSTNKTEMKPKNKWEMKRVCSSS